MQLDYEIRNNLRNFVYWAGYRDLENVHRATSFLNAVILGKSFQEKVAQSFMPRLSSEI